MHDATQPPEPRALETYLGNASPLWNSVIASTRERAPDTLEVWNFASAKVGWSLRLVDNGRILVYLTPGESEFRVGIVLGKKAVASARSAGMSPAATTIIDAAPTYAEGHGIRMQVNASVDLPVVQELIAIKVPAR